MIWPTALLALPLALLVDRIVGDPTLLWTRIPHPVAVLGRIIAHLDATRNDLTHSSRTRRLRGVITAGALVLAAAASGAAVTLLFSRLPILWRIPIEAILVSVLLAQKSLVDHVSAVAEALRTEGLSGGRKAVAKIVGRDVSMLDEAGVARAAIESAAENFSDGLIAPVFWYAALGLPGLFIFKTISTADSMIGYRSPRHEAFGWASAKLDDVLSFLPARISALLIATAALSMRRDAISAIKVALRDARLHKSPNAGWPEAAAAGALGLALGGPRHYADREVDGAWLNAEGRYDASIRDIRDAVRLTNRAWGLTFGAAVLSALVFAL